MPEIDEECTFVTKADDVRFSTQTNGDVIMISKLNLSSVQAASLAWLVNHPTSNLVFTVELQE